MPFGTEGVAPGIGLALSGGGFRAALFHCGVLWRLNELAYLPKLTRISMETTAKLARTRARLNPFTEGEQCSLINWGYAICDAAMRRFVAVNAAPPSGWPYPDYALDRPLAKDVRVEDTIPLVDVRSAP
jgi:hypothetical protein